MGISLPPNANILPESPVWEQGIYQYEITDPLQGGSDGIDNLQGKQLANRTAYLKKELEDNTDDLQRQITSMQGRGGYLTAFDFGTATPTQQQLTDYALGQIGQTDRTLIWDNTHVKNMFNGHVWVLNNTPETDPPVFEWVDDGLDSVSIGNNDDIAGIVKGGREFDSVYIDALGRMRVPGLRTFQANQVEGLGRDLMAVILGHGIEEMTTQSLRNEAIAEVMANIRYRSNNNSEIDGSGVPNFTGLNDADFLDGLDLSAIAAPTGGTAPQAWNANYKNTRLLIAGFNNYKHSGDTENTKNHVVFITRHIVAKARMRANDDNAGGYAAAASELRAWLEGANGDGSGPFATGLKAALGGNNPLLTIRKLWSTKGGWNWFNATVFPLTTVEVFGTPGFAEQDVGDGTSVFLPIYQKGSVFRVKRWNGSRDWWWMNNPSASSAAYFCVCSHDGNSIYYHNASAAGGVAPAFCVA